MDGEWTDDYVFDNKYSSIDEYVGGDAYNYIIGASFVAGKTSGAMTSKAICIVGGVICVCLGITLKMMQSEKEISLVTKHETETAPTKTQSINEIISSTEKQ